MNEQAKTKREPKRSANPDLMLLADVIDFTTLSKPVIYRMMDRGTFPQSIQLAPNRVAWRSEDVRDWMEAKFAQADAA